MTAAALVVVLAGLCVPAASARPELPRIAVMPPAASPALDAELDVARVVADAVARGRVRIVPAPELARIVTRAADAGIGCPPAIADCAVRIGAFGGLDFVVVTTLEQSALGVRATLQLFDLVDGREVKRASALLGADTSKRRAGLSALARALVDEGTVQGRLVVTGPTDALVFVDGVARGAPPLDLTIDAGPHEVLLRTSAGPSTTSVVDVPVAATAQATFAPDAAPDAVAARDAAPVPLLVMVGAGVGALGAASALAFGIGAAVVAPDPAERARYTATGYNDAVALGRVLVGVGVAGLLVAAVGAGVVVVGALE